MARRPASATAAWSLATLAAVALAAVLLSGCGRGAEVAGVQVDERTAPPPASAPVGAAGAMGTDGNTAQGAAFARWVQATDPERRYILDAYVRDDRTLGVKVNPHMTKGQVQQALTSLMRGMQRSFPERDLEVIAYYESGHELARMTYDARSGRTTTTWQ